MARWLCCSGWVEPDAQCRVCGLLGPGMAAERQTGKKGSQLNGDRVARILGLRAQGLVAREIAERVGCHIWTVYRHLHRYGMGRLPKKKI